MVLFECLIMFLLLLLWLILILYDPYFVLLLRFKLGLYHKLIKSQAKERIKTNKDFFYLKQEIRDIVK